MSDSPSALARFFESEMRRLRPRVEWQPNAPALANHFKNWLGNGLSANDIRLMVTVFISSEVGGMTAFDMRLPGVRQIPKAQALRNPHGQQGLAGVGYDARTDPNWPWVFFLAARQRMLGGLRERNRNRRVRVDPYDQ